MAITTPYPNASEKKHRWLTNRKRLYDSRARNFWIHNTGPLGYLGQNVVAFGNEASKLDELGSLRAHNQAAKAFNLHLKDFCTKLQSQHLDVNVTYVDVFTIKFDLIVNSSKHGFEQPIMACCGYGGLPLNCDNHVSYGLTKILNGTHYTEASNQYVASQILTGNYFNTHLS